MVATGSLTNVGLLFRTFPELANWIRGLSIMGGALGGGFSSAPLGQIAGEGERLGNVSRWAEFNIYVGGAVSLWDHHVAYGERCGEV